MDLSRRGFLAGLLAVGAAPAIIRTPGLLMPIKPGFVAIKPHPGDKVSAIFGNLFEVGQITFSSRSPQVGDTITLDGRSWTVTHAHSHTALVRPL